MVTDEVLIGSYGHTVANAERAKDVQNLHGDPRNRQEKSGNIVSHENFEFYDALYHNF